MNKFLTRIYPILTAGFIVGHFLIAETSMADVFDGKAIVVKDPAFGEVLYDFYQGNYLNASVKLMVAKDLGRVPHHREDADLLLGGLFLFYGLHWDAESLFNQAIENGASAEVRDRAWYHLGKVRYQKGLPEEAIRALEEVKGSLAKDVEHAVKMQMANLAMDQQKYGQAIKILQDIPDDAENKIYARYNLGVAYFKNNQQIEGATELDTVGQVESDIPEVRALRDQANIALGYALLVNQEALKAKEYFQRVRLNGPFSNKALLGLGWANALLDDYQEALAPWMELRKRQLSDASVYESQLAVPYGLEKLKAYPQSLKAYEEAIGIFEDEIINVDKAIKAVKAGRLWEKLVKQLSESENRMNWAIEHLPDEIAARYITGLIATHEFQESIKNLLELRYMGDNLDRWKQDTRTFIHMILLRKAAYEERLPKLMPDQGVYKLASFKDEKDLYQEEIDRIEFQNNIKALATSKELAQIDRLNKTKHILNRTERRMDPAKHRAFQDKYYLLRGLLEWNIGTTIKPRQWKIKRGIRDIEKLLKETQRQDEAIRRARDKEPKRFDKTLRKIRAQRKKISVLKKRADQAYQEQRDQLESLVVSELNWLRKRLTGYLDQARYGIARLQDFGSR